MRRANPDFYTAHPMTLLSDEQLAEIAASQGMTVEELREYMTKPKLESTCPLCGRASTHTVGCKGCGGGSWGYEMEEAYGYDVIERLRNGLEVTLQTVGKEQGVQWGEEKIKHAVRHAYQMNGCMICPNCWDHTLPHDAYQTCPLNLHAERITSHSQIPFQSMLLAVLNGEKASEWVHRVFAHWCKNWNTAYQTEEEKQAIAALACDCSPRRPG